MSKKKKKVKSFSFKVKVYADTDEYKYFIPKTEVEYIHGGAVEVNENTIMKIGGNDLNRKQVKESFEDKLNRFIGTCC